MFSCRYTSVCKHQKMQQLGWNTLEVVSTNQARAVMMYRIVNGLIAIPASLYLTPNTQNTRGHNCKFHVPAGCVDAFNYSFFPFGFETNCRLLSLCLLLMSIDGHPGDSDNLETFILFLSYTPARFYLSVELGFTNSRILEPSPAHPPRH